MEIEKFNARYITDEKSNNSENKIYKPSGKSATLSNNSIPAENFKILSLSR